MTATEFNKLFKVGTKFILTDDFGTKHKTKTTTAAWDLCGTVVVSCERFKAYDISRLELMSE